MLKIDSIKIDIKTSGGLFGSKLFFKSGLNIVRANNTSGKSSLYGAIVYGLGFEELLGSKNDKALQSVFKSLVKEYVEGDINNVIQHDVLQSEILLEISNQIETVTIKRTIIHGSIKPQAVEVFLENRFHNQMNFTKGHQCICTIEEVQLMRK